MIGTRLGPYEILSPLGAGGMGEVYRARDTRLDRQVAIKVLPERLSADADALARFEREAKAVAALSHPNIIALLDFGTHEGAAYAVMELLDGETLRTRLERGPFTGRKAVDCAVQIARGLAAAHEKGIVHRDLKPENVFLTSDGHVKVLDFGLAKTTGPAGGTSSALQTATKHTGPGTVMGTVGYMSPEQVRAEVVDHRSDIFSFGAVLYEMLSSRRAFSGSTAVETMNAILKEDPPEITATGRTIPPGLERVVRHCLEKSPAERFQSARDLAFALDALSGTSSSPPHVEPLPQARTRRTLIAAVIVVACLGLALIGVLRFTSRGAREVTFKPLNFRSECIFNARFAPDGRTIVYSSALSGNQPEIFTVSPDYPEPRSIGLKRTALLSISSKGELALLTNARYINHYFFIGTLARMPLGGGAPREIVEGVREADWSPDGSQLAIIRDVAGMDRIEYPPGKVLAETAGYFSDLRLSPDGQRIALFEHPIRYDDRGGVIIIDLQGKKTTLSEGWTGEEGLAWSPGGRGVLFSAGFYLNFTVHEVTLSGSRRSVLTGPGGVQIRDVAGDGRWLVSREDDRWETFALAPGEKAERNLSWFDGSGAADLSADGRLLLFREESMVMGLNYAICLRGTDGSPPVRLGEGSPQGLSPDGKLALAYIPTSPAQLMLYPTGPGDPRRLDQGPIRDYQGACWFPDSKRILVCGSEPGHAQRCYVQDIAGGAPRAVTPEGTKDGLVSPDGAIVIVRDASGRALTVPLAGDPPTTVPFLTDEDELIGWTRDGRSLLVNRWRQVPSPVERVEIATGRREILHTLSPPDLAGVLYIKGVLVAKDADAYAYSTWRQRSSLFLVEGAR